MSRPNISVTALVFGALFIGVMFPSGAVKAEGGFERLGLFLDDVVLTWQELNNAVGGSSTTGCADYNVECTTGGSKTPDLCVVTGWSGSDDLNCNPVNTTPLAIVGCTTPDCSVLVGELEAECSRSGGSFVTEMTIENNFFGYPDNSLLGNKWFNTAAGTGSISVNSTTPQHSAEIVMQGRAEMGQLKGKQHTTMDQVTELQFDNGLARWWHSSSISNIKKGAYDGLWRVEPTTPGATFLTGFRSEGSGIINGGGASFSNRLCAEPALTRFPD